LDFARPPLQDPGNLSAPSNFQFQAILINPRGKNSAPKPWNSLDSKLVGGPIFAYLDYIKLRFIIGLCQEPWNLLASKLVGGLIFTYLDYIKL
jgi:hypothetical protein